MPPSAPSATPIQLPRQREASKTQPIAGMKSGWYYRESDQTILHRPGKETPALPVGAVPKVTGVVTHLTDDGEPIRTEYQIQGPRGRKKIVSEDELDRGTWAAKVGMPRPSGADARLAFATVIRRLSLSVDPIHARSYYDDEGNLVLPDAEAQPFGYMTTAGTEKNAREVWEEIGAFAATDPTGNAALVLGAMFVGPVLDSLQVLAHIVNLFGPGQQGKSTALTVASATLGDIRPKRQKLMMTWNASKQGITQGLRMRGYLPVALDEHSSSGRTVKESSREFSQIVAGAIREMGTADGSPRESDGFWHSVLLSSSNQPLRWQGQTEDLASRLQEIGVPFFANQWMAPDGNFADPASGGAEHLSKRLKRLAKSAGGWPLVWAVQNGTFDAENLAVLKKRHLELCAEHSPRSGGIPDTIAEIHMAWVVGAEMLEDAIGGDLVGVLADAAKAAAAARMREAIQDAAEANVSAGELLWTALAGVRFEGSAFPDMEDVDKAVNDTYRTVKGFYQAGPDNCLTCGTEPQFGHWWVKDDVVKRAAAEYGVENVMQALRQLAESGVHCRGTGGNAQRLVPRAVRGKKGISPRLHCFCLDRADVVFGGSDDEAAVEGGTTPGTTRNDPRNDPERPGVVPLLAPLTSAGTTGTTGTTFSQTRIHTREGERPELEPLKAPAADLVPADAEPEREPRGAEVATLYPAPAALVTDTTFDSLTRLAKGRTRSGLRFGVLGADEAGPALYLPNCQPVPVRLPGSVNEVPALMDAYELRTLWVHESAALAMGLPTCAERKAMPPLDSAELADEDDDQEQDETQLRGAFTTVGPQTPVAHPWTTLAPAGPVASTNPGGLASWLTLVVPAGESERRLNVALPLYDTRYDKNRRRGGFGGASTPAEMLDALMVWTLASQHGHPSRPQIVPFYVSVNRVGQDFAGGRGREDVLCEAVRRQEIAPLLHNAVPLMVPQQWGRPLTAAELGMSHLHQFDKTAAWLGSFGSTRLGIGEPVHQARAIDLKVPGFWRVSAVPGTGPEQLPALLFREATGGGYWLSTPSASLLCEIYPEWVPDVVEAWWWPEHKRALEGMYDRVRTARSRAVEAIAAGRPGAVWAKQLVGRTYQSFRGYMSRNDGPMVDRETGGDYRQDIYYRPDWARLIMDQATANMYRNLLKFAADGVLPLAVCVDALTFASNIADPITARPASMVTGTAQWTHEGSALIADLLPELETIAHGRTAHHILSDHCQLIA